LRVRCGCAARFLPEWVSLPTLFVTDAIRIDGDVGMNSEILRLVDAIHRAKRIDKEIVFKGIEAALATVSRKHFETGEEVEVTIDRETGDVTANDGTIDVNPVQLGRIAAQTAKQIMIQKIREAERDVTYDEYSTRVMTTVTGSVARIEGQVVLVNLGKAEGVLRKQEQIRGEVFRVGEHLKALIVEVRKVGTKVKVFLSRTHPELVRRLFELEVPEIVEGIVEIKGIAREAGMRTKIAVISNDFKIDCVSACVGVRGTRIRNIIEELFGEKIDIVRYDEDPATCIANALKPAEIGSVELDEEGRRAAVIVADEQLSLAIGRKGQNVRLASRLSGYELDIVSMTELAKSAEAIRSGETAGAVEETNGEDVVVVDIPGLDNEVLERLQTKGLTTVNDIIEAGVQGLCEIDGIDEKLAETLIENLKAQTEDYVPGDDEEVEQPEEGLQTKNDVEAQ